MSDEAVQAAMQHEPDVVVRGTLTCWGICTCGWRGEERSLKVDAWDDISAHLRAVLPDDAPGSIYR